MSNADGAKKVKFVEMDPTLKVAQCPCGSFNYRIILEPNLNNGAADLRHLVCSVCDHMIQFDGDATIGQKTFRVDKAGIKHHILRVNPGKIE